MTTKLIYHLNLGPHRQNIKQLLNIAEGANTNMHEAIAQEDEDGRYHEFGKVVIAEQQVTVLTGEAENCIGEELVFLGPTEIDVR